MAKAKSKKITIEDALVPVEEQPYDIPENWCWVKLEAIVSVVTGKKDANYGSEDGEYTFFTCAGEPIRCDGFSFEGESLLLPGNGANVGQVFYYNGKFEAYQRTYVLQAIVDNINLKYLYYQMLFAWNDANKDKQFGSATNYIKMGNFTSYDVPLPPLAEQKRIVEQIENLFAKLDEAKEKAQDVVDNYDVRYASILRSLFDGELSKEWREENSVCKDSWASCPFDTCIEKMQNGLAKRSGTEGKLFGVLRLANLREDDFDTDDLREIRLTEKEQEKYKLNVGDIIMIRVNGSRDNVGRQLLVDEEQNWAFCDHIMRMKLTEDILPQYMVLFSKTDEYRYYIEEHMVSSAGQNTISRKGMSELAIPVPSIEEQEYMVKVINRLISKEKLVKEKVESVIEQIELMKKSILAKAFRGELGTNIPEESSIELLKKMIEEG